jgi:flagellar protein FliO/FliZ
MIKLLVIFLWVGLFTTSPAFADDALVQAPPSQISQTPGAATEIQPKTAKRATLPVTNTTPAVSTSAFFGEVMVGLILVLLMIFALAWLVKRMGAGSFLSNQHMKIVASVAMGTRERVALLDVGGKQILLGITPQNINTLHVFDEPVIITEPTGEKPPSDFSQKIKYYMQKGPSS